MENEKIFFREYVDSDLKGVLDLWEYFSDWGRPQEGEFNNWLAGPFGSVLIFLAVDNSDRIVGQIFFTPTLMYLRGMEVRAVKISAPIIHEDYRSFILSDNNSLVINLFLEANKFIKEKGYDWVYSFPAYAWVRFMQSVSKLGLNPWKIQTFPCLQILEEEIEDGTYRLHELNGLSNEFNLIWEEFRLSNPNFSYIDRSKQWLEYKWGKELIVGILDSKKKLVGYFIIKKSSGLILDFLMKEFLDVPLLFKKLKKFHLIWMDESPSFERQELKIMTNNFLEPFLNQLKTQNVSFNFVFGISSIASAEEVENLGNYEWFIFPND